MKIVFAGGRNEADFLIGMMLSGKHKLIVINEDRSYCEHLSSVHDIPVILGDPCKEYILQDAGIKNCDVMIALGEKDADNLAICQMAKRLFAVKKTVCTVNNPKNVELCETLGVDRVISATYMLAHFIEQASMVENIVNVLPLNTQKVLMNEIKVDSSYPVVDKKIMEIDFPHHVIISCIIRGEQVVVPNGQTKIMAGDRLLVLATPENQENVVKLIIGSRI